MIDKVTANARKPKMNVFGNQMLERMNNCHNEMALWALNHLDFSSAQNILDIGCGGGKNIENMLSLSNAKLYGIDYSMASVKKSKETNYQAVNEGRAEINQGDATALPFEENNFDIVTAFETVYYWPEIIKCFNGIWKILKKGGSFLVCNEDCFKEGNEEIIEALDMDIYSLEELASFLKQAGFSDIKKHPHENGRWICLVATK